MYYPRIHEVATLDFELVVRQCTPYLSVTFNIGGQERSRFALCCQKAKHVCLDGQQGWAVDSSSHSHESSHQQIAVRVATQRPFPVREARSVDLDIKVALSSTDKRHNAPKFEILLVWIAAVGWPQERTRSQEQGCQSVARDPTESKHRPGLQQGLQ